MSNPRISVSQLKQLIQLHGNQMTTRSVARALSLSQGAVSKYGRAVLASCQTWEAALELEETELERRVFAERRLRPAPTTTAPDCAWIHTEMKRHKHVTLQLLWEEYHGLHGTSALRYSAFCERYRHWARRLQRSMRQRHFAGEKLFVDYAGRTVPIYGASCEEAFRAAVFVGPRAGPTFLRLFDAGKADEVLQGSLVGEASCGVRRSLISRTTRARSARRGRPCSQWR